MRDLTQSTDDDYMDSLPEIIDSLNDIFEKALTLSTNDLNALSDEDLYMSVLARTEENASKYGYSDKDLKKGFNSLNDNQKIFYTLSLLETEVNNGGLCQFFCNSSKLVAPFVSEYLLMINATEHKKLFDNFISKNNIDLNELSSFIIEDLDDFPQKYEEYPFDDYDDRFYELKSLEEYLVPFIRKNIESF